MQNSSFLKNVAMAAALAQPAGTQLRQAPRPYHETCVQDFHDAFGHPVRYVPQVPELKHRLLRVKLIAEELAELAEACGVELRLVAKPGAPEQRELSVAHASDNVDLVEVADALTDLRYVVDGSTLVYGIPGEECLREVHSSNMSKLGSDGRPILAEDGKVMKGPNYRKPDLAAVLDAARSN